MTSRSFPFALVTAFIFSCTSARPGDDPSDPDAGDPVDPGPDAGSFWTPAWVKIIQGGLYGPSIAWSPDGTIVVAFNKGYDAAHDQIVIGAGDPGEIELVGRFKPVVTWLGADAGQMLRARQVAKGPQPGGTAMLADDGVAVAAGGAVFLAGQWQHTQEFHPGTAAAVSLYAENRLVGGTWFAAYDPFITRHEMDSTPAWTRRGRTPGPISDAWFNDAQGIAPQPTGGVVVVGKYADSGFVFGDGTSGATTLVGQNGTYVARVDDGGTPTWVGQNHRLGFYGIEVSDDGSIYAVAGVPPGGGTLLDNTNDPTAVDNDSGLETRAVIKIGPDNQVAWVRKFVSETSTYARPHVSVSPDGRVVVTSISRGRLEILAGDESVEVARTASDGGEAFAASWAADGSFEWAIPLGEAVSVSDQVAIADDGTAFLAVKVAADVASVPLEGGFEAGLPRLDGIDERARLTLLYRISADGARESVRTLGLNLDVSGLAIADDGRIAVTGAQHDSVPDIRVGASGGQTQNLPVPDGGDNGDDWMIHALLLDANTVN